MGIKQSFSLALKSLLGNKVRALLTMLGIIIGVAAVIVLVSLMNGLSDDMTSQFEEMGTNTITVNLMGRGGNRNFTVDDMEQLVLENPDYLEQYSPTVSASVTVKSGASSVSTTATGVNEYYQEMQSVKLSEGRFIRYIDAERRQKVCIIGTYLVEELFDGADPLGETVKINGSNYTVVGVVEETEDSEEGSADDVLYIPYSTATRLSFNGQISSYMVTAADTEKIDETVTLIKDALYKAYGSEAYMVTSMTAMIDTINEMTGMISTVLVGIAAISLLVGGIGIMNIMLVSVTERTREIGIRKALGARRKHIMQQFVIEAATTSALGGVIGIFVGIVMAFAAGNLLDMSIRISVNSIGIAFGVSVAIGILFGYFPASKAAKMNPIDALRYD